MQNHLRHYNNNSTVEFCKIENYYTQKSTKKSSDTKMRKFLSYRYYRLKQCATILCRSISSELVRINDLLVKFLSGSRCLENQQREGLSNRGNGKLKFL